MSEWRPIKTAPKDGTVIIVHGGIAHFYKGQWHTLTGEQYPGRIINWPVNYWQPFPEPPSEEKLFEVWSGGYLCSGMDSPAKAQFHGKFRGKNFTEACKEWVKTLSEESKKSFNETNLTFWGCGLFDNEYDARKTYG